MQEFAADLKHRMGGVWRDAELVNPNKCNSKLATYHPWFAIHTSWNERMPTNVPRYLLIDLFKRVVHNFGRFRLLVHTLKLEAAAWLESSSRVCDQCPGEGTHFHLSSFARIIKFVNRGKINPFCFTFF
jgi:hypothetical protein